MPRVTSWFCHICTAGCPGLSRVPYLISIMGSSVHKLSSRHLECCELITYLCSFFLILKILTFFFPGYFFFFFPKKDGVLGILWSFIKHAKKSFAAHLLILFHYVAHANGMVWQLAVYLSAQCPKMCRRGRVPVSVRWQGVYRHFSACGPRSCIS